MQYYNTWPFNYSKKLKFVSNLLGSNYYYNVEDNSIIAPSFVSAFKPPIYRISNSYHLIGKKDTINHIYKQIEQNKSITKPKEFDDISHEMDHLLVEWMTNFASLNEKQQDEILFQLEPSSIASFCKLGYPKLCTNEYDKYWKTVIKKRPDVIRYLFEVETTDFTLQDLSRGSGENFKSYFDVYKYLAEVKMI